MINIPSSYNLHNKKFNLLIDSRKIQKRIVDIAIQIDSDYKGKSPVLLVVMKGALVFAAELMRNLKINCELETIRAQSFQNEMHSSGYVHLSDFSDILIGKDIIIIEDIIDSGLTISKIKSELKQYKPTSLRIATLLVKPKCIKYPLQIDYTGFEIDPEFVVGYGLDYAEYGRNLPGIYILEN